MRTTIEKTVTTSVHSDGKTDKDITTAKTSYSAVKALSRAKGNATIAKTAAGPLIAPLTALIVSMDIYKKIMSVVGIVTPIVKAAARASGIMHSPGNVADIAQIILGEISKILVYLATMAVVELKEFIWNIEIPMKAIDESASDLISSEIENNGNKLSSTVVNIVTSLESITNDSSSDSSSDSSDYSNSYVEELKEMKEEEELHTKGL